MEPITGLVILALVFWCGLLTAATIILWAQSRSDQTKEQVQRLQDELWSLRVRIMPPEAPGSGIDGRPPAPAPVQAQPDGRIESRVPAAIPARAQPSPAPTPSRLETPAAEAPAPSPAPKPAATALPIPPRPAIPVPRPARASNPELEALVGGNWLLKIGVLAVVLGVVYFLKYAFDNEWIGNRGRVLIGALAGIALLGAGDRFQKRGYPLYGQSVVAGGISILYLSIYAAFNFYSLLAQPPAFVCMALVTATGCVWAARHKSKTLAVMSQLGGLLTPFWLNTGRNNETGLLGYLLILDLGVGWMARRLGWNFLNAIGFAGTTILFHLWAVRYYGPYALWTTELFLVLFAGLFLFLFRDSTPKGEKPAQALEWLRWMAPLVVLLFFFASSAVLGPEPSYYWTFLLLFDAAALAVSLRALPNAVAPGVFLLNAAGVAFWMDKYYQSPDHTLVSGAATGIFLLFLVQQLAARKRAVDSAELPEVLCCLGTGFGYFGLIYYAMHLHFREWMGLFAVFLAAIYFISARYCFRCGEKGEGVTQSFIGTAVTLITLAIPIQLSLHWITIGWAAEAVVLTRVGFSTRALRIRQAGLIVLAFSLIRLLALDATAQPARNALILNPRFFTFVGVIAAAYLTSFLYRKNSAVLKETETPMRVALLITASALTVLMMTVESLAFFQEKIKGLTDSLSDGVLSRLDYLEERRRIRSVSQVVLSILWSAYSIAAVTAGIRFRFRPIRIFGIGLFFVTIFKVFMVDIWNLERLDRIISVVTLGLILMGAAFLYQRFRKRIVEP